MTVVENLMLGCHQHYESGWLANMKMKDASWLKRTLFNFFVRRRSSSRPVARISHPKRSKTRSK